MAELDTVWEVAVRFQSRDGAEDFQKSMARIFTGLQIEEVREVAT